MTKQAKQEGSDPREKYWNEDYVRYWRARVDEANKDLSSRSEIVEGDTRTSSDAKYIEAIMLLGITEKDRVLEIGCGFGRSLPELCKNALEVSAVDISQEMINIAKDACPQDNVSFHVSPSESLPFADGSFDSVVCFAAFDAMYQAEALVEINRVSKVGAKILVTGKNDNYFDDDSDAMAAEIGARSKGHPNYFTDVAALTADMEKAGFGVLAERYYLRRGDFSAGFYLESRPEQFYEYLFVLGKIGANSTGQIWKISSECSRTFLRSRSVSG